MSITTTRSREASDKLAYKDLIDDVLWTRLVSRIVKDHDMDRPYAERVVNEMLGFLKLCSTLPTRQDDLVKVIGDMYRPSEMVDIGWHTFILYTGEYAKFCQRVAGHFIHHNPSDIPGVNYAGMGNAERTATAMRELGPVDGQLWQDARADCSSHCGG